MIDDIIDVCPGFKIKIRSVGPSWCDDNVLLIEFSVDCPSMTPDPSKPPFGEAIVEINNDGGFNIESIGGVDIYATDLDWDEDGNPIPTPWGITDLQPEIARLLTEHLRGPWSDDLKKLIAIMRDNKKLSLT